MAEDYGISSLAEARAYLGHPVLGLRLDLCTRTALEIDAPSLDAIFGLPTICRSCVTLFALASGSETTRFSARLISGATVGRTSERLLYFAMKIE